MTPGIRAELKVQAAVECPLSRASAAGDATAYSVSKSVTLDVRNRVTEEFTLDRGRRGRWGEGGRGDEGDLAFEDVSVEKAFESGSESIYRFERPADRNCPCECIEAQGYPVADVRGERGTLYVVFHAPDREALKAVIAMLGEHYPQVEVRRLVQSSAGGEEATDSLVFFDKSVFTDRQQEVLETAHRLGYFDHPKGSNAGEVAEALGITTATFIEHLSAAQRKLLDSVLVPADG